MCIRDRYNPCFFFAMDKAYGTKTMYKQFIDACHEAGMAAVSYTHLDVYKRQGEDTMTWGGMTALLCWGSADFQE